MFGILVAALENELKRHPITLLVVVGLAFFAVYAGSTHARVSDVESLSDRIDSVASQALHLELTIERATLDSQLENIERELFAISRGIEEMSNGDAIEPIYKKRKQDLLIAKRKKESQLSRIDAQIALHRNNRANAGGHLTRP